MVVFGLALAAGGPSVIAAADPVPGVTAAPIAEPMVLGADADGQAITLSSGQELVVALPDNPSTGYHWQVAEGDQAVLRPEGEPQFRGNPGDLLPGGAGNSVWTFTAGDAGATHLTLVSVRAGDPAPAQQFSLNVTVR
ncbi:protease inhibitor I42 family protein [Nocardia blacklockiae]|uniref:protease inhibitor I42 family protein n=1 Tax=Nocardia blacklockiae TaxID=480036 RepID=UPI001895E00A|nr:protease inhibitor I42 family protein [Nocardia blacklockiae]MBF6175895.1 protease inhibitor I42 family protein [Nocardia blacklockiae]